MINEMINKDEIIEILDEVAETEISILDGEYRFITEGDFDRVAKAILDKIKEDEK